MNTANAGQNVTLLPVNPTLVFVHWHLEEAMALERAKKGLSPRLQFRIRFPSSQEGRSFREAISSSRGSDYFQVPDSTVIVVVDLGYETEGGEFESLVSSSETRLFPPAPAVSSQQSAASVNVQRLEQGWRFWQSESGTPDTDRDITAAAERAFAYGVSSGLLGPPAAQ